MVRRVTVDTGATVFYLVAIRLSPRCIYIYNWFPIEHVGEVSKIVILGFQGSCTSLFRGASP